MEEILKEYSQPYCFYAARQAQYHSEGAFNFRVSPRPYTLTRSELQEIERIGQELRIFLVATDKLYHSNELVQEMLMLGKPDFFYQHHESSYLFFRPDILVRNNPDHPFAICEIETSPFGLALSDVLTTSYSSCGFKLITDQDVLKNYLSSITGTNGGKIVWSNKTKAYAGQLQYLADRLFGDSWSAEPIECALSQNNSKNIYRGFYLHEYTTDRAVLSLLEQDNTFIPSLTPHMEEKAILALLWDRRFKTYYETTLGKSGYAFLRHAVVPTWVVGYEEYSDAAAIFDVEHSIDLADRNRSGRDFILKPSGFCAEGSWAEGVYFLGDLSREKAKLFLEKAHNAQTERFVIQPSIDYAKRSQEYLDPDKALQTMLARTRITPYYAYETGELLTAKATLRQGTRFIHASSDSINIPLSLA